MRGSALPALPEVTRELGKVGVQWAWVSKLPAGRDVNLITQAVTDITVSAAQLACTSMCLM